MTLEIKFSGVTPAQALKLIMAADAAAEVQTESAPAASNAFAPSAQQTVNAPVQFTAPVSTIPVATAVPGQTVPTVTTVPTAQTVPTAVRQYTQDELAVAARPLCENEALRGKLLELLHTFSYTDSTGAVKQVQSIRDLPPESYAAMANGIRQLGGKI